MKTTFWKFVEDRGRFLLLLTILAVLGGTPALRAQETAGTQETLSAQKEALEYPGRPRYADGKLELTLSGGITKYIGEFTDNNIGTAFGFNVRYAFNSYLSAGIHADKGTMNYERRSRQSAHTAYQIQFCGGGECSEDQNGVMRSTPYTTFSFDIQINLLPTEMVNIYLLAGYGWMWYTPEDYTNGEAWLTPDNPDLMTFVVPLGTGVDVHINRQWAVNIEGRFNMTGTKDLDAFPSDEVRNAWYAEQGTPVGKGAAATANDNLLTFMLGVKYFMFPDSDFDRDGLLNSEEEQVRTNPYDKDTDGDGLSDYEEVKLYHSDPLLTDTDDDGLNDFVEIMKYHTLADVADTDKDGVSDKDEILVHGINPLNPDTDGDGMNDADELVMGANPNVVDTDKDGLTDGDEINKYKTDPLLPDSDGEGFNDFDEVYRHKTDPMKADTDDDGLTDFEEVMMLDTDPMNPDSDGDGMNDYDEVRVHNTNPLQKDTDADGIEDGKDKCPKLPETYNGFQDGDGCPDKPERNR